MPEETGEECPPCKERRATDEYLASDAYKAELAALIAASGDGMVLVTGGAPTDVEVETVGVATAPETTDEGMA